MSDGEGRVRGSRLAGVTSVAIAAAVVVVALWEIVATRAQASSVPDDAAWARAAAVVRADHRPGDLIVVAPGWADPVGRLHLGDLIPVDMAARMDSARYGRIWELAIRGAHAPDVAGLTPARATEVDGIAVRLYERAPAVVVADVREALPTARLEGGSARLELAEVGFEPHRCVLVTAAPNRPVRITLPQLSLGTQLVGYVGIADIFTRRDSREPVTLDVELAGKRVATATAGVDDGWVRFAAATTPGPADVTFVARWSGARGSKQICFAAEARR